MLPDAIGDDATGTVLQGKSVKQRPSTEAPNIVAEKSQHTPVRKPSSSLADRAQAECPHLSAAITPAIESMLQVAPALYTHFWMWHSTFSFLLHCVVNSRCFYVRAHSASNWLA